MKPYKKSLVLSSFFFSVLIFSPVSNGDEITETELLGLYGSEEFISIATGHKQLVSKAPAAASVIHYDQMKEMGATELSEVLETVPGLHVAINYQGYNPIYTFRGMYSSFNPQVLFLIDGVPQTNLFTGGRNLVWGGMPIEAIDSIEVMRGPGSAIYGADAFAGVINIITKTAQNMDSSEAGVRIGSFDTKDLFFGFRKSWDEVDVAVHLQAHDSDGADEVIQSDAQSFLDTVHGTSASIAPGPVSLPRENLDVNIDVRNDNIVLKLGYQGRRDFGVGAGISQALNPSGRFASDRFMLDFNYKEQFADDLSLEISASHLNFSQEVSEDIFLFPPGSAGPFVGPEGEPFQGIFNDGVIGNPEVYETHSRLDATFHYEGLSRHDLTLGTGYYFGDLYKVEEEKNYCTSLASCDFILPRLENARLVDVSDTPFVFLQEGARENHYLYVQDVYSLANDWQLTAGVRYDKYSDFGDTVNPRLALVWSTSNDLTTKFLYGEAFRAPAFAETRAINNPGSLGNPDLEPETLESYELVFDYKADYNLDLIFNAFYYEWEDIILFVPDSGGGTSTAQNFGRQTGYGFETEANWAISSSARVKANYAWQRSTNTKTDSESANSPGRQLFVQGVWEFAPETTLNLQANWVMDRSREFQDLRDDVDDYVVFDLTLRRKKIWRRIEAALIVKNIFDEDVREPTPNGFPVPAIPNDLPLPGRSVMGELRFNF